MDYFKSLPVEITVDILTRLPTELVLECKSVCTNWRNLVSHHSSFSKMHFHRHNDSGKLQGFIALTGYKKFHYFEKQDESTAVPIQRITRFNFSPPFKYFRFIGSCNGLICLVDQLSYPAVWICNPITREYLRLPQSPIYSIGFGYVSSTNQYKVVGIHKLMNHLQVHIYTLGSGNGWRNLGNFNFEPHSEWRKGVFVNGVLYWLNSKVEMVIAFDLAEEQFRERISPPPFPPQSDWCDARIGVLDGLLFFFLGCRRNDIWILKPKNHNHDMKEGEEHQSMGWSKEFRIDIRQLFAVTKSNRVLTYGYNNLSIYDTTTSTSKTLVKFKSSVLQVSPHQNTLVSLKELGEADTNVMASVEIGETISRDYSFEQIPEDGSSENIETGTAQET